MKRCSKFTLNERESAFAVRATDGEGLIATVTASASIWKEAFISSVPFATALTASEGFAPPSELGSRDALIGAERTI